MARTDAVWGIDIGQCALKALRCRPHDEPDRVLAEAFDYIEYPKILSQPDAEPEELIVDALKQFLSRNTVRGDRVAISVSGQSGLARFIKLPPVEAKKIPDIVRYEARQQIPFDLSDVIWDYQRMGGGAEEEGFALETEIGLFAMKRDAVFRALEPFQEAGIDVDFVQLTPLALYNFILFDQITDLPDPEDYDPENPPASVVILSLGTDASDLVVTNGYRVWQRNIPIGGNHFTKALTRELKLTFAKAEHLKRNATTAADPKAVFQAMRPVFSDLLTELQRSIGYFSSIDRAAKISHVVALGNAMRLPGLRRYLAQSLGFEVVRMDEYRHLVGNQVISAPAFKDNALSFGVCYGLAVQGLGRASLQTNLLPKEIVKDRLIAEKKPWTVAAVAALALACGISFAASANALRGVHPEKWAAEESTANQEIRQAATFVEETAAAKQEFDRIDQIGQNLVGNVEKRILWLEMIRALNECLKCDELEGGPQEELPEDIAERRQLHLRNLEVEYWPEVAVWYAQVKEDYQAPEGEEEPEQPEESGPGDSSEESKPAGPSGEGWIVMITGEHYHNFPDDPSKTQEADFVRRTLIENLHHAELELPTGDRKGTETFDMRELGISYPVLIDPENKVSNTIENINVDKGDFTPEDTVEVTRFRFLVHFVWQPLTPSERAELRQKEAGEAEGEAQD